MSAARWLLKQCSVELDPEALIDGLARELERLGLPLFRMSAWLPTQHPELWGSQLIWQRGEGCRAVKRSLEDFDTPTYRGTPAQALYEGSPAIRCRLDVPREQLRFAILEEIASAGGVDYFIIPVVMPVKMGLRGHIAWLSLSTDRPSGFTDAEIDELTGLQEILALHFQLLAERYAKRSLLEVYLGPNAAERVMAGAFHRGTGTLLRAAIWFCDLRGFTSLSDRVGAREVVEMLDRYFECVAGPIEANGGEILKLIGDAALAIFPLDEKGAGEPCRHALAAAEQALDELARLRDVRPEWPPFAMGVALHVGEVLYGNIGGKSRLDFTVIGPAVNEVCRVESLCKQLGTPLLMTHAFVGSLGAVDTIQLGGHALRGVSDPLELSTLRRFAPT
jgi:adenylate cyclase